MQQLFMCLPWWASPARKTRRTRVVLLRRGVEAKVYSCPTLSLLTRSNSSSVKRKNERVWMPPLAIQFRTN